jgi:hypothetical protein
MRPTALNACGECGKFTDFVLGDASVLRAKSQACSVCHAEYHSCCKQLCFPAGATPTVDMAFGMHTLEMTEGKRLPWEKKGFAVCVHCAAGYISVESIYDSRELVVDTAAAVVTADRAGATATAAAAAGDLAALPSTDVVSPATTAAPESRMIEYFVKWSVRFV